MIDERFGVMGSFRTYKMPASNRLSGLVSLLCKHTTNQSPIGNRSSDLTGALDENVPEFVLLVWEFEEWKTSCPW